MSTRIFLGMNMIKFQGKTFADKSEFDSHLESIGATLQWFKDENNFSVKHASVNTFMHDDEKYSRNELSESQENLRDFDRTEARAINRGIDYVVNCTF
jgi:hypothetical protein